jgi:hypothetical protein
VSWLGEVEPLWLMNPTSPRQPWIELRMLKRGCDLGHGSAGAGAS